MVEQSFSKESVEKLRPHIQKTADDLLDAMLKAGGKEPVDLVKQFALPLPSYVRRPYPDCSSSSLTAEDHLRNAGGAF